MALTNLPQQVAEYLDYMTTVEQVNRNDFHSRGYFGVQRDYQPPTVERRLEAALHIIAEQEARLDERDMLMARVAELRKWNSALSVSLCGALVTVLVILPVYLGAL